MSCQLSGLGLPPGNKIQFVVILEGPQGGSSNQGHRPNRMRKGHMEPVPRTWPPRCNFEPSTYSPQGLGSTHLPLRISLFPFSEVGARFSPSCEQPDSLLLWEGWQCDGVPVHLEGKSGNLGLLAS